MKVVLSIAAVFVCISSSLLSADDLARSKKVIESARSKYDQGIELQKKEMDKLLTQVEKKLQAAGDLKGLEATKAAHQEFKQTGSLPSNLLTLEYRKNMTMALEFFLAKFQDEIRTLTRSGNTTGATLIEDMSQKVVEEFERKHPNVRLHRIKWVHSIGRFEKINDTEWVEHTDTGRYSFREQSRNPECVVLFDSTRNVWISLNDRNCTIRNKKGAVKPLHEGSWAD